MALSLSSDPPPLPGLLEDSPYGSVEVAPPASEKECNEHLRDLARALRGGSVYLLSRNRLEQLVGASPASSLETHACEKDLRVLADALAAALRLPSTPCGDSSNWSHHDWFAQLGQLSCWGRPPGLFSEFNDPRQLMKLARRVAEHVSVGPSMAVALENKLPPALWQPIWVISCACTEVRVVTFAFAGSPVMGDNPTNKRTPFIVRLTTPDLRPGLLEMTPRPSTMVTFAAVHSSAASMHDYLATVEDELFAMASSGDWSSPG